jgi:hypothetical protein
LKLKLFLCSLVVAGSLFAQQPSLTNQRVIELMHSGVTAAEIQRLIASAPSVDFLLTPTATDELLKAGVSEDTVKAMSAREQGTSVIVGRSSFVAPNTPAPNRNPEPLTRSQRVDIFAGYSFMNIDTNQLSSRQNLNGFETSATFNIVRHFAAEGAFSGYFKSNVMGSIVSAHDLSLLGGPRVNFGQGFVHALVGFDRLTGTALGLSASQNSFAAAFGGGGQSRTFARHFAIRVSADYVLGRHNIFGGSAYNQNNFRVSSGIVFVFGGPVVR